MAAANRHVTSPADLRAHDTAVANIFTEAATSRAQAGDPATALACQWVGDIHRVTAALWARVSAHADPHQEFFSLAEQVLMAADQVPTGNGSTAPVLLAELRSAFSQACTMLNVPLVFPAAGHLTPLTQLVDLNDLRGQVLGGMETGRVCDLPSDRCTPCEPRRHGSHGVGGVLGRCRRTCR